MQKQSLASFAAHASSRRRFAGRAVLLPSLSVALLLVLVGPVAFATPSNQPNIAWTSNGTPPGWPTLGWWVGTWAPETAGIGTLNTVAGAVTYGWLDVVAAGNLVNAGTLTLNFPGYTADNRDRMTVTMNGGTGTLSNTGTLNLNPNGSYGGLILFYGKVVNETGGALAVNSGANGGAARLATPGAAHLNRGTWTAIGTSGNGGVQFVGSGTSFVQDAAGADLTLYRMVMGDNADATQNSFAVTAGSVSGSYTFWRTAATLGAGVSVPSPTTFRFQGDNAASEAGLPANTWTGNVPANLTLVIARTGTSTGSFLDATGSFANAGTITVTKNDGYDPNGAYGRLRVLNNGTLTNSGTFNLEVGKPTFPNNTSQVVFDGSLINQASGLVAISTIGDANGTGNKTVLFTKTDASYSNHGLVTLSQATTNPFLRWELTGGTLVNEATGIIRGSGTTVASTSTILGNATLDNAAGTIEAVGSSATYTLAVNNALSAGTRSAAALLAGTYQVIGGDAATTLSLNAFGGAGAITTLGGGASPATVTLDGATATFTQLEGAAGSLAAIAANGTLNLLGGKSFVAASTLANAGVIAVGAGSSLGLGGAGTGTLNSTGTLTVDGVLGGLGATINVSGGTLAGSGAVFGSVNVSGSGILSGLVAITGNTLVQGLHSPGDSPAIQTVDGNYTLAGGTLLIELGGTTPGSEHDQVVVTGDAVLDGILAVEFLPGYFPEPKKGVTYDVLTAASINIASGFGLGGTWGGMFLWEVLDEQEGSILRLTSNIPEPASALLLLGLAAAGLCRRRDAGIRNAR